MGTQLPKHVIEEAVLRIKRSSTRWFATDNFVRALGSQMNFNVWRDEMLAGWVLEVTTSLAVAQQPAVVKVQVPRETMELPYPTDLRSMVITVWLMRGGWRERVASLLLRLGPMKLKKWIWNTGGQEIEIPVGDVVFPGLVGKCDLTREAVVIKYMGKDKPIHWKDEEGL